MMKRCVALLTVLLALTLLICGCGEGEDEETEVPYYTVTFNSNGGTVIEPRQVTPGALLGEPTAPVREGYVFDCWMNGTREWDFSFDKVKDDMTLTATWIAAESLFEYERIGDTDTAVILGVKKREIHVRIPTVIAGYRVVAIGEEAFSALTYDEMEGNGSVTLPATVTEVRDRAFHNSETTEIVIEGELTSVGEGAFYNCKNLKKIRLGEGLISVGAEAFRGCEGLESIVLPSTLKVFEGCLSLRSVVLWNGIETVGDSAFSDCEGLGVLYFRGSEEELEHLMESAVSNQYNTNEVLFEAKKYLYSETEPETDTVYDGFWYVDDKGSIRLYKEA